MLFFWTFYCFIMLHFITMWHWRPDLCLLNIQLCHHRDNYILRYIKYKTVEIVENSVIFFHYITTSIFEQSHGEYFFQNIFIIIITLIDSVKYIFLPLLWQESVSRDRNMIGKGPRSFIQNSCNVKIRIISFTRCFFSKWL